MNGLLEVRTMIEIKQIGEPRVIGDDKSQLEWMEFHASMSTIRAMFDNHLEVSKGNQVWDLTVYGDRMVKLDITPLWSGLSEHAHCFKVPMIYSPFGYDGGTFCYTLHEGGTYLYDFAKNTRMKAEVHGIWAIRCSHEGPLLLISGTTEENNEDGVYLVDFEGKIVHRFDALDANTAGYLDWLLYKPTILAINQKSRHDTTWLYEIDPDSGEILQRRNFNPQEILPYDLSYSSILGENAQLLTKPGQSDDGLLWNNWSNYSYAVGHKKLRARIMHPSLEFLNSDKRPEANEVEGIHYEYEFRVEFT